MSRRVSVAGIGGPDALFHDRFAGLLAGEKGKETANNVEGSRFTAWTVAIRTFIIDAYIRMLLQEGVASAVNLGAGLDARPYRLELPSGVQLYVPALRRWDKGARQLQRLLL